MYNEIRIWSLTEPFWGDNWLSTKIPSTKLRKVQFWSSIKRDKETIVGKKILKKFMNCYSNLFIISFDAAFFH